MRKLGRASVEVKDGNPSRKMTLILSIIFAIGFTLLMYLMLKPEVFRTTERTTNKTVGKHINWLHAIKMSTVFILTNTGSGTGFILTSDGYIITNNHVVENTTKQMIKLSGGRQYNADIVAMSKNDDLAILKINGDYEFDTVSLGNSDEVQQTDKVIVVGFPLADKLTDESPNVSTGTITNLLSDKNRIVTDAAMNPGNSGGPICSAEDGKVIGVAYAKVGGEKIDNIGLAIPIKVAISFFKEQTGIDLWR